MTDKEVLNSIALKKRFCKDCNLPISVYDNPYFLERIYIIDELFDSIEKFDTFCEELEKYSSEQEYFEEYNRVKEAIIESIRNKPDYIRFNNEIWTMNSIYEIPGRRDLYIEDNNDKLFISIDMKKANFNALRHYSDSIFDGCSSWEQFVSLFTDSKHIRNSKYIRQVIFGACNPKKQTQYEKYLMTMLYLHIKKQINDNTFKIYSLGEDEIIICLDDNTCFTYGTNKIKEIIHSCPNGIGDIVRFDMFVLSKVKGTDGWCIEHCEQSDKYRDAPEFKCIDSDIFHQIVKHYYGYGITGDDLVFYHNGRFARYIDEIENPWKNEE